MIDFQNPGPPQGPGKPPLSPDEFRARARAIQDENPTAFEDLNYAAAAPDSIQGAATPGKPAEPTRFKDALGRGMTEGANEASNATVGLGGWVTKHVVPHLLDAYAPGFTKSEGYQKWRTDFLDWYDSGRTDDINPLKVGEPTMEKLFGKPQHGLGGFVEGVGQVATGMIATGGLAMESKGAEFLAKDVLISSGFFDPYQKRIANWIGDSSLPIASDLGKFMSSHPDDSEAVARLKTTLEFSMVGKLLGSTLHVLNAARLQAWAKVGKFAGGSEESAAKAISSELKLASEAKTDPKAPINVVEHEDGSASVVPTKSRFRAAAWEDSKGNVHEGFNHADAAETAAAAGVNPEHLATDGFVTHEGAFISREKAAAMGENTVSPKAGFPDGNAEKVRQLAAENAKERALNDARAKDVAQATKDADSPKSDVLDYSDADLQSELDKVQGKQRQYEVDSKNGRSTNSHDDSVVERTHLESYRRDLETEVARRANGLHFESAGEAHNFAASVVEAMRSAELPTTTVSKETADGFRTRVRSIITESKSLDELEQKLMQWGSDFNFSRSSSPAEAKLQIEALSQELPSITEMARALGTQPHEVTAMLARSITRHLDAGQAVAMAKKMFGDTKDLPQRLLATRGWLYAKGAEVARLSKMVDGAPTNAVAMHELTETLDQLWDFHSAASGTASNVGRTLDALKIDPQPLVSQIEQQTMESEGQQAARQASDVLEAKATGKTPGQQAEEAAAKAETNGKTPKAPKAPRQTTPEQAAVRQAAEDALQDLKRARADMVNKRFDKDTPHSAAGNDAPNATDMSLVSRQNEGEGSYRRSAEAGLRGSRRSGLSRGRGLW
jgi:hypothetical protein